MIEDYGMLFIPERSVLLKVHKDKKGLWVDARILGYAVIKLYIKEADNTRIKSEG